MYSNPSKYYTTAALALYVYDYCLTLPDEVSPRTEHKIPLEAICQFRRNTSGGAEKLGVSSYISFESATHADSAVFYMFLIVGFISLSCIAG